MQSSFHFGFALALLLTACGDSQTRGADSGDNTDSGLADARVDAAQCPDDCDDGIACTIDGCDEASGLCTHESGVETCDEIDNDCDGSADEDLPTMAWYIDRDDDRRGDLLADPVLSCGTLEGHSIYNDDCDDDNRAVRPTATEVCNHFDDDCDAMVDENVSVFHFVDVDRDGRGAGAPIAICAGTVGFVQFNDDCDDNNAQIHPGLLDVCDSVDNDCDSTIDESQQCDGACQLALATVCDPHATCTEANGAAVCSCPYGFVDMSGGSATGIACVDVNECLAGLDDCATNATCVNTIGSYSCECNEGYAGNGVTCIDIDECADEIDECGIHGTCVNTSGAYTCDCDDGYAEHDGTCEDLNECALGTSLCHNNAACMNTPGSYTCHCITGFEGNGISCFDIQECNLGVDNCSANASCAEIPGSYTCTCNWGYAGNGVTCTDVDECLGQNPCNQGQVCTNTIGSFSCSN